MIERRDRRPSWWLIGILLIVVLFVLLPIYWLVVATTKNDTTLFGNNPFVPNTVGNVGSNFSALFTTQGGIFGRWLVNSVIYAGVTALLTTYLSAITGVAISKFRFHGRRLLIAVIIGSFMVPNTVLIVPLFILEHGLHLTNTYEGVILPLIVFPFGVYFMSVYSADAVPDTLLEAARVDGARIVRVVHQITLPLVVPGMVTLFLIAFIGVWNNYFLPLVLIGSSRLYPLTVGLEIWLSTINSPGVGRTLYLQVITGSFVSILPMLILFPVLQKYIARGLTLGAVVGE